MKPFWHKGRNSSWTTDTQTDRGSTCTLEISTQHHYCSSKAWQSSNIKFFAKLTVINVKQKIKLAECSILCQLLSYFFHSLSNIMVLNITKKKMLGEKRNQIFIFKWTILVKIIRKKKCNAYKLLHYLVFCVFIKEFEFCLK